MNKHILNIVCICTLAWGMSSCNNNEIAIEQPDKQEMTFKVVHPAEQIATRVDGNAFETNDQIGVFVTDRDAPLEIGGNYVNNAKLTYSSNAWKPESPIYWNNGTYNVYAYYPYASPISSVDDMPFKVATDQSSAEAYEASDFLWANSLGTTASNDAVTLMFKHRMSRLYIKLIKGDDYEGELPDDIEVYIHSTVPTATIDLSAGVVTRDTYGSAEVIKARSEGNHKYSAIIIPQRLNNRQPLVEVITKGVSYLYESKFLFKAGMQHNVQLAISKNPEQIKIEIGGEVENWTEE